jgi:hypothetical protein
MPYKIVAIRRQCVAERTRERDGAGSRCPLGTSRPLQVRHSVILTKPASGGSIPGSARVGIPPWLPTRRRGEGRADPLPPATLARQLLREAVSQRGFRATACAGGTARTALAPESGGRYFYGGGGEDLAVHLDLDQVGAGVNPPDGDFSNAVLTPEAGFHFRLEDRLLQLEDLR